MADDYDTEVHTAGAGASDTYPEQCSKMRKGGYVMIKNRPCKVVEMSTSKTGKHGHAKVHFVGLDIFTGKKYEDICPSTHSVNVPHVNRLEFQVVDFDDGFLECMDDKGSTTQFKAPDKPDDDEIRAMLAEADKDDSESIVQATIWKACGIEMVLDMKLVKQK